MSRMLNKMFDKLAKYIANQSTSSKALVVVFIAFIFFNVFMLAVVYSDKNKSFSSSDERKSSNNSFDSTKVAAHYVKFPEPFIIGLHASSDDHYLQANFSFVTRDAKSARLLYLELPLLRDQITRVLEAENHQTLQSAEGRENLLSSIQATAGGLFRDSNPDIVVERVLFTSFVLGQEWSLTLD